METPPICNAGLHPKKERLIKKAQQLILTSFFTLGWLSMWAQDIIVTRDDVVIEAKVIQVSSEEVIYRRFDYPDGPKLSIGLDRVKSLVYGNGEKENLQVFSKAEEEPTYQLRDADFYVKGLKDGEEMYNATGGIVGATGTTVLFWPAGLITSIVLASSKPKPPFRVPHNKALVSNPTYVEAYREAAHRKKKSGVWAGFGVGTVIVILIGISTASGS